MEIFRATKRGKNTTSYVVFPSKLCRQQEGRQVFSMAAFSYKKICCNSKVTVRQECVMKTDPAQRMKSHPKPS